MVRSRLLHPYQTRWDTYHGLSRRGVYCRDHGVRMHGYVRRESSEETAPQHYGLHSIGAGDRRSDLFHRLMGLLPISLFGKGNTGTVFGGTRGFAPNVPHGSFQSIPAVCQIRRRLADCNSTAYGSGIHLVQIAFRL